MSSPRFNQAAVKAITDNDPSEFVRLAQTEIRDLAEYHCVYFHQATIYGRLEIVEWLLRQPSIIDYLRRVPHAAHYFFLLPPRMWHYYINNVGPFSELAISDNDYLWPEGKKEILSETIRELSRVRARL